MKSNGRKGFAHFLLIFDSLKDCSEFFILSNYQAHHLVNKIEI